MRNCTEQRAEVAERMRAHRVIELDQHVPIGTLVREDGEVVFPEIGHHFAKLPLTENGACNLRFTKIRNYLIRCPVGCTNRRGIGGYASCLAQIARGTVDARQARFVLEDRRITREELFGALVIDRVGCELLADPSVNANLAYMSVVSRTRAECEPVHNLPNLLLARHLARAVSERPNVDMYSAAGAAARHTRKGKRHPSSEPRVWHLLHHVLPIGSTHMSRLDVRAHSLVNPDR